MKAGFNRSGWDFYDRQSDSSAVEAGSREAAGVQDVAPYQMFSEEYMIRLAWQQDFEKTLEQSVEEVNKEIIQPVVNHPVSKVGYVLSTELTPFGDVSRILVGVDPYTGKELTWSERKDEAAQTIAFNFGGRILKIPKAMTKVVKPRVFELQDRVGGAVDTTFAIKNGIQAELNESDN
jgi:hypothetical protein